MLSPGTTLQGRYRISHKLGEGGMGAVYEATDERFGTPIALKEIIFEAVNDKQNVTLAAAFEREAKSLAKARHEAIPFVRDYFSEENRQFLVMELVEGDDLGELLLENNGPFLLERAVEWMKQLLDALDYLHGLKPPIIHRDIKPQNLKLTSRKRLKLLDFGIAKSGEAAAVATRNQTFIGATLNYSPIEQILRVIDPTFREFIILKHEAKANAVLGQQTDARADIFAAGATFYHLLTNHLPEDATKRTLDAWEGKTDPLPHPSDLNPAVPRTFGDLVLKAMEIDREHRFGSAAEMLDAVDAFAAGKAVIKPTAAPTVPLLDRTDVPVIKPTVPVSAAVEKQPIGVPTEPLISQTIDDGMKQETPTMDWSAIVSRPSFGDTEPNSAADLQVQNQATVPDRSVPVELRAKPGARIIWAVVGVAGVLAVTVIIVGVALMEGSGSGTRAPAANTRQNTLQPVASPWPSAQASPSPTPVPSVPAETRGTGPPRPQTGLPAGKNPPRHASNSKSKPDVQNSDCVYTNTCKSG